MTKTLSLLLVIVLIVWVSHLSSCKNSGYTVEQTVIVGTYERIVTGFNFYPESQRTECLMLSTIIKKDGEAVKIWGDVIDLKTCDSIKCKRLTDANAWKTKLDALGKMDCK